MKKLEIHLQWWKLAGTELTLSCTLKAISTLMTWMLTCLTTDSWTTTTDTNSTETLTGSEHNLLYSAGTLNAPQVTKQHSFEFEIFKFRFKNWCWLKLAALICLSVWVWNLTRQCLFYDSESDHSWMKSLWVTHRVILSLSSQFNTEGSVCF